MRTDRKKFSWLAKCFTAFVTLAALLAFAAPQADAHESSHPHEGGRVMYVTATAYSALDPGNSPYTATGTRVRHGVIAVDPAVIPLGTRVYIPDYGEAVAEDIGWGIQGHMIDVAFDTHEEALMFGRQVIEIYVFD